MYTGIVRGAYALLSVEKKPGLYSLLISLPEALLEGLGIGASVALDGVCLTVATINADQVGFDVMGETLSVTTLGQLQKGSLVNVERSAKQGAEIGGHVISGHVDGMAEIVDIEASPNNRIVSYRIPDTLRKYIFRKGFIGLNGCSLTIVDVDKSTGLFRVSFIPETLRVTTHGDKQVGDCVNVEIDRQTQVIVDTVEAFLADN